MRFLKSCFRAVRPSLRPPPGEDAVFRRSCATELVRGNANLYHISRMLGHERFDTLRHYVRLNIADIQKTHRQTHPRERDEMSREEDGPQPQPQ